MAECQASRLAEIVAVDLVREGSVAHDDQFGHIGAVVNRAIETQPVAFSPKVQVVSIAPLLGEAIKRIHNRESISVLFET